MAMDPTTETISTIMQEVVAAQGVRNAVNLVLNGLLHVTERQELYAAVAGWADDNAMLALPPLDTCSQANSGDRADSPLSQYSADDRNVTGDPKTPLVLPGSVPTKDPPGVVGASGRKKSVAASPNRTPWLTHSGLPCNAPTTANDEIIAFSAYVQALPSEVDGRTAVRLSLQKFIQGSVSTESMLKHIGGSAYCVAAFDSALDLVIENSDPSVPSDTVLEVIVRSLQKFEVESTLSYVYGFPAVRMKSGALWKSSWIQQAAGNARLKEKDEPEYVVHIFKDTVETGGLPQPRVVAPRLTTRFTRAPALKRAAFAIKSIFRTAQMGDRPGVVNGYLLLLLLISVIDDRSPAEVPEDASDVLRLFFSFYATFDFKAHTIAPSLSPPRPQADPSPIFLPRRDMDAGAQLSMLDPLGSGMNVGANVTMLPQLTGMIHYFNLLIVKHDSDPRKTLLLSNLVTCSESLWKRQEFLQRSLEVTQPLAVSIARSLAQYLTDTGNIVVKEELLHLAAWDSTERASVFRNQLMLNVISQPQSTLSHFKSHTGNLLEALARFKNDPEVEEQRKKEGQTGGTKAFVASVAKKTAYYVTQPRNISLLAAMARASGGESIQKLVFHKIQERIGVNSPEPADAPPARVRVPEIEPPAARAGPPQKPGIAALLGGLLDHEVPSSLASLTPEMMGAVMSNAKNMKEKDIRSVIERLVTPDVAKRLAQEAASTFAATSGEEKKELVKQLVGTGEWSEREEMRTHIFMLRYVREKNPNSILHVFPEDVLDKFLPAFTKLMKEFSFEPAVRQARRMALGAAATKDLALVVKKDILGYVSDRANEGHVSILRNALKAGDDKAVYEAECHILCQTTSKPGSRMEDFRGLEASRELHALLVPFESEPEVHEIQIQIDTAIFLPVSGAPAPAAPQPAAPAPTAAADFASCPLD